MTSGPDNPQKPRGDDLPEMLGIQLKLAARRLAAVRRVLADREAELLELKGPCSSPLCHLHYAHRGPCDATRGKK